MKLQSISKVKKEPNLSCSCRNINNPWSAETPTLAHLYQKALKLCQSSSFALCDGPLAARSRNRTELTAAKHFVHSGVSLPCSSRLPSSRESDGKSIYIFSCLWLHLCFLHWAWERENIAAPHLLERTCKTIRIGSRLKNTSCSALFEA